MPGQKSSSGKLVAQLRYLTETGFGSFLLLVLRRIAFLAHGLAAHFDAVGVVNQTVQDAIGDGGIADLLVPARDLGIPVKVNIDSGRKPNGVPERR